MRPEGRAGFNRAHLGDILISPSEYAEQEDEMPRLSLPYVIAVLGLTILYLTGTAQWSLAASSGAVIPLPAADKKQIEKLLGAGVVGDPQPSAPLGTPESYMPPKGSSMTYGLVEKGKKVPEHHKLGDIKDPALAPGWQYTVEKEGSGFFQKEADGNLYMVEEQDLKNKQQTRYTPGDPLIIAGLKPGESRKLTEQIAVYDLSDLSKVSYSGSLDVIYTYVGTYRVKVPAGGYNAVLIKWEYKGEVGPADIEDSQYRFLAPGAGMVAMAQIRSITAMLLYNDHTKRGKLLEKIQ
jgi:hypothetical protein